MKHLHMKCLTLAGRIPERRVLLGAIMLLTAVGLSACGGKKEEKASQSLASVNGEEITVLQLNEELQRSGVQAGQQEAASKVLLESLIDRQLLQNEAVKDKTDRDPKVVQSIERAKAMIIAQAYMQKRLGTINKPTPAEVEDYFGKHPEFFTQRKQFDMNQLIIASSDVNDKLKATMDGARSLEEVAVWLEANNVKFGRAQLSRTSADLAPELSSKLLSMPKGQLFIVREGDRTLLISLANVKDSSVTLAQATPQIEQFLFAKKNKDAADAELKRLRAQAKIEYLNKKEAGPAPATTTPSVPAAASTPAIPVAPANGLSPEANERGVAGLK